MYAWIPGCAGTGVTAGIGLGLGRVGAGSRCASSLGRRAQWRLCSGNGGGGSVSREQVLKTARLARIDVRDDEVEQVTKQFEKTLDLFNKLRDVDVDGVEVMAHPHDNENVVRQDVSSRFDQVDEILEQVPMVEKDFVRVPKIGSDSEE